MINTGKTASFHEAVLWFHCTILLETSLTADDFHCVASICSLQWRHNDHDGVSNHQPHGCLLKRLFRRRSKKTSKFRVTGLCVGNSPGPVNSPHKELVTRKMFPFDDVIMFMWPLLPHFPGLQCTRHRIDLFTTYGTFGGFLCNPFMMLGGTWWFHKQNLHPI